jgi:hypothetical protein
MRQGNFRIIFWLSICLVALTGCKLPDSAFVGKWKDQCSAGCYIEISRTSIDTFDVVESVGYPFTARAEYTFATCGDALCREGPSLSALHGPERLRFPEKGNLNLLLDGEVGDDSPNFPFKMGGPGEDLYKRVQ